MESWTQSIVSSLVTVIITLAGVIGYLKANSKSNNPNGCKSLDAEFKKQIRDCNQRFLEIAEDRGEVKTSLKNIENDVADIKKKLRR